LQLKWVQRKKTLTELLQFTLQWRKN